MEVSNLGHWWVFRAEKQQRLVSPVLRPSKRASVPALFNIHTKESQFLLFSFCTHSRRVSEQTQFAMRQEKEMCVCEFFFYSRLRSTEREQGRKKTRFLFLLLSGEHTPWGLFLFPCSAGGGGGEFITLARRKTPH